MANGRSGHRELTGRQVARQSLPKERLEYLYVQQNGTFLEIAREEGLNRKDVARLVNEYGLPRHTYHPRGTIDRGWLYTQYTSGGTARSRTSAPKLACPQERWPGGPAITKFPSRTTDTLSRPDLDADTVLPVLRPVLGNDYQLRRLRTFIQVAGYHSIRDACTELGLSQHSVTNHLLRLEEELGGPLLVRALKNRLPQPTELGQQVLAAARSVAESLGVPEVTVPAEGPRPPKARRRSRTTTAVRLDQVPVLLRPAAGTYGGRRRLHRFVEAARYPSLAAFARDVGLDPSVVTVQVRPLEGDLDGELLIRGGNGHAMRLTALGRKVLVAAQPHADQLGDLHGPRRRRRGEQDATPSALTA